MIVPMTRNELGMRWHRDFSLFFEEKGEECRSPCSRRRVYTIMEVQAIPRKYQGFWIVSWYTKEMRLFFDRRWWIFRRPIGEYGVSSDTMIGAR